MAIPIGDPTNEQASGQFRLRIPPFFPNPACQKTFLYFVPEKYPAAEGGRKFALKKGGFLIERGFLIGIGLMLVYTCYTKILRIIVEMPPS